MNCLQQEAQQLRTKEIHINDLLQPYQEKIAQIVDTIEQKMKEFTTTREENDASISQALLDSAQERVAAMQDEVAVLHDKLQQTSQEAKEKIQQEKPACSGLGTSHK